MEDNFRQQHRGLDDKVKASRILLVDDDEQTLELLKLHFRWQGFSNLVGVRTGVEALDFFKPFNNGVPLGPETNNNGAPQPVELVLLDLMLPDIAGEKVLKVIREHSGVPVLVLTARNDHATQVKILTHGAEDYLVKPVDRDLLIVKSEKLLQRSYLVRMLSESNERHRKMFINVLQVMAKVLEARDPYTQFHSESVARYSRKLAELSGFDTWQTDIVGIAGILHDFGKIGMIEGVLNKPGHLSDDEYEVVKRHPLIATNILEPLEEMREIIALIRHHHEHFNGHGYPDGLAGDNIPLGSRILALADAFDAMTSRRAYHEPKTIEQAKEELRRCSGAQFDPKLVDLFIHYLDSEDIQHRRPHPLFQPAEETPEVKPQPESEPTKNERS